MSGFVLHPEACADLEEIWEYIAADSLDAANRVREEIYDAIHSLAAFPYLGHNRPDLTARPLRFQSVRDSMEEPEAAMEKGQSDFSDWPLFMPETTAVYPELAKDSHTLDGCSTIGLAVARAPHRRAS